MIHAHTHTHTHSVTVCVCVCVCVCFLVLIIHRDTLKISRVSQFNEEFLTNLLFTFMFHVSRL